MYLDRRLEFSSDQAVTADAKSTNVIDLGSDRDIGPGEPIWLIVAAKVGLGGTSPTLDLSIETDDNEAFASAETIYTHPQLTAAGFVTGDRLVIPMPQTNQRFLRLDYNMGGTSPTMTVDAYLTNQEPENWQAYPNAID